MPLIPEAALNRNHPCEACPRENGEQGSTASYYAAPRIHHRPVIPARGQERLPLIPETVLHRNHPCEACPRGNGEQGSIASYYAAPRIHHCPKDGFLLGGRNDGAGGPLVGCPAYERVGLRHTGARSKAFNARSRTSSGGGLTGAPSAARGSSASISDLLTHSQPPFNGPGAPGSRQK